MSTRDWEERGMSRTTSDSPLKVTADVKDLVRYGAAVFACTQGEFVERAVATFLELHAAEVEDRAQAVNDLAKSLKSPTE